MEHLRSLARCQLGERLFVGLFNRLRRRGLKHVAVALEGLFVGVRGRLAPVAGAVGWCCWLPLRLLPASEKPVKKAHENLLPLSTHRCAQSVVQILRGVYITDV